MAVIRQNHAPFDQSSPNMTVLESILICVFVTISLISSILICACCRKKKKPIPMLGRKEIRSIRSQQTPNAVRLRNPNKAKKRWRLSKPIQPGTAGKMRTIRYLQLGRKKKSIKPEVKSEIKKSTIKKAQMKPPLPKLLIPQPKSLALMSHAKLVSIAAQPIEAVKDQNVDDDDEYLKQCSFIAAKLAPWDRSKSDSLVPLLSPTMLSLPKAEKDPNAPKEVHEYLDMDNLSSGQTSTMATATEPASRPSSNGSAVSSHTAITESMNGNGTGRDASLAQSFNARSVSMVATTTKSRSRSKPVKKSKSKKPKKAKKSKKKK